MNLHKMMEELSGINDIAWGRYAFSRDFLRDKIDNQTKEAMIRKAILCGYEKADEVIKTCGTADPGQIAEKLHLKVQETDSGQMADRILFALFTPPNLIQIMEEPIKKAAACPEITDFFSEDMIKSLILGHEIFHYLEENDETIYTRTEKITLWKFLGYANKSTVRALSEIAGIYFTKKLKSFTYSPFALDIILYYNYDSEQSERIYKDIMRFGQEVFEQYG